MIIVLGSIYFYLRNMYNMKIFNKKIRSEIIVISLLVVGFMACFLFGSCHYGLQKPELDVQNTESFSVKNLYTL